MTKDGAPKLDIVICPRCGCLVADKKIHNEHHRKERG